MNVDTQSLKNYEAKTSRYDAMQYRRCGKSGIQLPVISVGLWHNFGHADNYTNARKILRCAFDNGVCHFDLANNYGPPFGAAEETFGRIFQQDFKAYRNELFLSSKAGWDMWPGPYGNFGSRKYLIASLDQSLQRMGVDYVDVFYHHRPDPDTPLEETMGALHSIVQQGKALYVGVSQYPAELTKKAVVILKDLGTPLLIHQPRYSMFDRWVEKSLMRELDKSGVGAIAFSPLEQGVLTNKYLKGFPKNSRAVKDGRYLKKGQITTELLEKVKQLNDIAQERGQSLAQMAIAWILRDPRITSVLVGVSSPKQMQDNVDTVKNLSFTRAELKQIEKILK